MRAVLPGSSTTAAGQYRDYAAAEQRQWRSAGASFMYERGVLKSARNVNAGLAQLQAASRTTSGTIRRSSRRRCGASAVPGI
jgi:hypothetical protein